MRAYIRVRRTLDPVGRAGYVDKEDKKREERRRRGLAHPTRQRILACLGDAEQSSRDPQTALGDEALSLVGYHLSVLERAEVVRWIGGLYGPA